MRLLIITLAFSFSLSSFAKKHMVSGNTSAGYFDSNAENSTGSMSLYTSYQNHYFEKIQVGGVLSAGLSEDYKAISFGPKATYNLSKKLNESIYGSGALILNYTKLESSDAKTSTSLYFGGGKRYKLAENISYSPELFVRTTSGSDTTSYGIRFFQLDIFL